MMVKDKYYTFKFGYKIGWELFDFKAIIFCYVRCVLKTKLLFDDKIHVEQDFLWCIGFNWCGYHHLFSIQYLAGEQC